MSEIKYGGEGYKYKDICALFGDNKASGGKDRATQLEKWQKKYEIDKVGTRYIIQREYDEDDLAKIKAKKEEAKKKQKQKYLKRLIQILKFHIQKDMKAEYIL